MPSNRPSTEGRVRRGQEEESCTSSRGRPRQAQPVFLPGHDSHVNEETGDLVNRVEDERVAPRDNRACEWAWREISSQRGSSHP